MKFKTPKDIHKYVPKIIAIGRLISLATDLLFNRAPLFKWELKVRRWDPKWEKKDYSGYGEAIAVSSSYTSGDWTEENEKAFPTK